MESVAFWYELIFSIYDRITKNILGASLTFLFFFIKDMQISLAYVFIVNVTRTISVHDLRTFLKVLLLLIKRNANAN